jgi:hypothetical protein
MDTFPRWPLLEGALFRERSNWGQVPAAVESALRQGALLYTAGDQTAKFIISRNPKLDTMYRAFHVADLRESPQSAVLADNHADRGLDRAARC